MSFIKSMISFMIFSDWFFMSMEFRIFIISFVGMLVYVFVHLLLPRKNGYSSNWKHLDFAYFNLNVFLYFSANIEARSNPRKGKKPGLGTGRETLRFKANGKCQIEEEVSCYVFLIKD